MCIRISGLFLLGAIVALAAPPDHSSSPGRAVAPTGAGPREVVAEATQRKRIAELPLRIAELTLDGKQEGVETLETELRNARHALGLPSLSIEIVASTAEEFKTLYESDPVTFLAFASQTKMPPELARLSPEAARIAQRAIAARSTVEVAPPAVPRPEPLERYCDPSVGADEKRWISETMAIRAKRAGIQEPAIPRNIDDFATLLQANPARFESITRSWSEADRLALARDFTSFERMHLADAATQLLRARAPRRWESSEIIEERRAITAQRWEGARRACAAGSVADAKLALRLNSDRYARNTRRFRLALRDGLMPRSDGDQFAREIIAWSPEDITWLKTAHLTETQRAIATALDEFYTTGKDRRKYFELLQLQSLQERFGCPLRDLRYRRASRIRELARDVPSLVSVEQIGAVVDFWSRDPASVRELVNGVPLSDLAKFIAGVDQMGLALDKAAVIPGPNEDTIRRVRDVFADAVGERVRAELNALGKIDSGGEVYERVRKIRSDGLLGVLYLAHRNAPGAFSPEVGAALHAVAIEKEKEIAFVVAHGDPDRRLALRYAGSVYLPGAPPRKLSEKEYTREVQGALAGVTHQFGLYIKASKEAGEWDDRAVEAGVQHFAKKGEYKTEAHGRKIAAQKEIDRLLAGLKDTPEFQRLGLSPELVRQLRTESMRLLAEDSERLARYANLDDGEVFGLAVVGALAITAALYIAPAWVPAAGRSFAVGATWGMTKDIFSQAAEQVDARAAGKEPSDFKWGRLFGSGFEGGVFMAGVSRLKAPVQAAVFGFSAARGADKAYEHFANGEVAQGSVELADLSAMGFMSGRALLRSPAARAVPLESTARLTARAAQSEAAWQSAPVAQRAALEAAAKADRLTLARTVIEAHHPGRTLDPRWADAIWSAHLTARDGSAAQNIAKGLVLRRAGVPRELTRTLMAERVCGHAEGARAGEQVEGARAEGTAAPGETRMDPQLEAVLAAVEARVDSPGVTARMLLEMADRQGPELWGEYFSEAVGRLRRTHKEVVALRKELGARTLIDDVIDATPGQAARKKLGEKEQDLKQRLAEAEKQARETFQKRAAALDAYELPLKKGEYSMWDVPKAEQAARELQAIERALADAGRLRRDAIRLRQDATRTMETAPNEFVEKTVRDAQDRHDLQELTQNRATVRRYLDELRGRVERVRESLGTQERRYLDELTQLTELTPEQIESTRRALSRTQGEIARLDQLTGRVAGPRSTNPLDLALETGERGKTSPFFLPQ